MINVSFFSFIVIILLEYTKGLQLNRKTKVLITVAGVFILTAVVLGAMAAHWLKAVLSSTEIDSFNTAVRYQMWMGIGAANIVIIEKVFLNSVSKAAWRVLAGAFLFSGSIYTLTLLNEGSFLRQIAGSITPTGGLIMISGWLIFVLSRNPLW